MRKEDFIAQYIEEYLEGKDEATCADFRQKPIDRQYGTIQTWRRRRQARSAVAAISADEAVAQIKVLNAQIGNIEEISPRDLQRLHAEAETLMTTIDTYEERRRQRRLEQLRQERDRLDREIQALTEL